MPRAPGLGSPAGPDEAGLPFIRVAAGVLQSPSGEVLIARRPRAAHGGGFWEFPGGKIAAGESPAQALARELAEELAIRVDRAEPLMTYQHRYPDRVVELHAWRVSAWTGEPRGQEGQPLQWLPPGQLMAAGLLPADLPIVEMLLKPPG